MIQLRKILLCDLLYIIPFILILLISFIIIKIPKTSIYSLESNTVVGKVTKVINTEEKTTFYIKNKETVIAYTYKKTKKKIQLGDQLEIKGTFILPSGNTTKDLLDYQQYLSYKDIFFYVKIDSYKRIKKNKNIYYRWKQKIIDSLHQNAYFYTFLLGDKTYLKNQIKRSYQENGISHLFAISGMHISLIISLIKKITKKQKITEEKEFQIITVILLFYLSLVGTSPSIVRAILFYILFSLNRIFYFYIKPRNIFFLGTSIVLLYNPYYLVDIGFLYSYCISFSLITLKEKLESKSYILSLLKISTISFIMSIPITLYYFYQMNILSIFYNLFFVPFISMIIFPFTILAVIIKPLEPLYNILINILETSSCIISRISIGKIIFKRLPWIVYIIYFIFLLLFLFKQKKRYLTILLILLIIHLFLPVIDEKKYIEVIDVGQGDSTLIHLEHKSILLDTGGIHSYNQNKESLLLYNTILPILKKEGIHKLEYLILTHGDYDHMGEAINLVNNFKVEKVIFNCGPYNDLEKELIKVLDKKKIKYYSCIKELNIDKNKLYFLQTKEYDNENDNSNVIYTELNGYKFMFMGDASTATEKEILSKYNLSDVDVLKVGHHGSKTSSSREFINEVNPNYSIISVGKNNRYGHPNKEVLNTLNNSKIYRTDQDGSIMFKIKNNKLKIETCSP